MFCTDQGGLWGTLSQPLISLWGFALVRFSSTTLSVLKGENFKKLYVYACTFMCVSKSMCIPHSMLVEVIGQVWMLVLKFHLV